MGEPQTDTTLSVLLLQRGHWLATVEQEGTSHLLLCSALLCSINSNFFSSFFFFSFFPSVFLSWGEFWYCIGDMNERIIPYPVIINQSAILHLLQPQMVVDLPLLSSQPGSEQSLSRVAQNYNLPPSLSIYLEAFLQDVHFFMYKLVIQHYQQPLQLSVSSSPSQQLFA